jgi:hypothetical protein
MWCARARILAGQSGSLGRVISVIMGCSYLQWFDKRRIIEPKKSHLSHERLELLEQRRVDLAVHLLAMLLADHEPGVAQLLQMVGDGGEGEVEVLGDLGDGALGAVFGQLAAPAQRSRRSWR